MKDVALVVPTIRENCFKDFYKRWESIGLFDVVQLIVMEDNPKRSFAIEPEQALHLDWTDIEKSLGDRSWIIPRRSDTVRSYAYWWAWKAGYKHILTLDDDCYPTSEKDGLKYDGPSFVGEHMKWLTQRSRWFNTLNSVKPRGIPFYNVGQTQDTIVNHGLWMNVLDYDAPYQLANPIPEEFSFDNRLVPRGQYFPMCGMNVMWDAEYTVLMYHLLMGQRLTTQEFLTGVTSIQFDVDGHAETTHIPSLDKLPFDRFGDIWCGIFMKKIADGLGKTVSTGMPYIRHERASNPFTNLKKEANGIEVNEKLWEYVDKFIPDATKSAAENYRLLGRHMRSFADYPEHKAYFDSLGLAMETWAELFMEAR